MAWFPENQQPLPGETYEAYLLRTLNWVERFRDVFSSVDERLDYLNTTMLRVEAVLRGAAPGAPDGRLDTIVSQLASLVSIAQSLVPGTIFWSTATGGTTSQLVDMTKNWATNIWAGYQLAIIKGSGAGQARIIKSNDVNSLTPASDFSVAPDPTSAYLIRLGIPANRDSFISGQKDVDTAGTPVKLPDISIPNGFPVIVMAKLTNVGYIYVGNSSTIAHTSGDTGRFDKLDAGDSIPLKVTNTNLIWIDSDTNGDGVSFFVEQ